ncbi:unnamed protein product [Urochloa decumbens]|uniref:F-box domain-containing protein n=1 Tax=Urochloa decumbens TaxID=240449 RepID=A0ABC9F8P3_9POAL
MRNCKKALAPIKNVPMIGAGDRLSALPEDVIKRILGFLPAREAVQTCVLAWFWRDLWKSATSLHISCGHENELETVKELKEFVDCILHSRGSLPLETCDIRLLEFDDDDKPLVNNWIQHVVMLNVQVLRLTIYHYQKRVEPWFELNNLPLVSQHLTSLDLHGLAFNDKFLDFSSCPVLQDLHIFFCDFMPATRIISQSLKRLCIDSCESNDKLRIQICTPNLVSLCLLGDYTRTPLLERMPSLLEAVVKINPYYDICYEDYCENCDTVWCHPCYGAGDTNNCVLLSGLSYAVNLALIPDTRMFIIRRDLKWCPIFTNLKTLLLNEYWCVPTDCSALVCILEHSPVLQKLTLQLFSEGPEHDIEMKGTCNLMTGEISKHLEIVEIKCEVIDKRILKVSTYMKRRFWSSICCLEDVFRTFV